MGQLWNIIFVGIGFFQFLLRLWKSHLGLNFLTIPSGLLLLLPVRGSSELLAVTASPPHSVQNRNVCGSHQAGQVAKNPVSCAEPRHARQWFLMCSASFPGPLMVLIHAICISHLDPSTYLSDDPWHNPKSYSCLFQKLRRGLPELFWFWQACINHSLASRLLHHVSSLVQAMVYLCSTQSILTPKNASLPSF